MNSLKITSGMSVEDIVNWSLHDYDVRADVGLIGFEDQLRAHGADADTIERELALARADIAAERISYAETVRRQTAEFTIKLSGARNRLRVSSPSGSVIWPPACLRLMLGVHDV